MSHAATKQTNDLKIAPSTTSSEIDFDFLVGSWTVRNRMLIERLSNCSEWNEFDSTLEMHKVLLGSGNFETYRAERDGKPFEGMAVRLFDPNTRLWSIHWADSNAAKFDDFPVVGSFEGSVGKFFANDCFNGKEIITLYQWDKTDPEQPVWSQAFSPDAGETWEWNWYMTLSRKETKSI